MAILTTGKNVYVRQGDTGNLIFQGLPTDKDYTAYMSIYNPETNKIISEVKNDSYKTDTGMGVATFKISAVTSNSLPIGEWTYGLKICATDRNGLSEDTVIPYSYKDSDGNIVNEDAPTFTVDYKYVEGVIQNG